MGVEYHCFMTAGIPAFVIGALFGIWLEWSD